MKVITLFFFSLFSLPAFCKIDIKPGLWAIKSQIEHNGKTINPAQEMQKAFANVPPEQRKKMAEMMAKMGKPNPFAGMSADGDSIKVCYTKEMLEDESNLNDMKNKKCKQKKMNRQKNKIEMSFECEDGTSVEGQWTIVDEKNFHSDISTQSKDGKKGNIKMQGKFQSSQCGKVKPYKA